MQKAHDKVDFTLSFLGRWVAPYNGLAGDNAVTD